MQSPVGTKKVELNDKASLDLLACMYCNRRMKGTLNCWSMFQSCKLTLSDCRNATPHGAYGDEKQHAQSSATETGAWNLGFDGHHRLCNRQRLSTSRHPGAVLLGTVISSLCFPIEIRCNRPVQSIQLEKTLRMVC